MNYYNLGLVAHESMYMSNTILFETLSLDLNLKISYVKMKV